MSDAIRSKLGSEQLDTVLNLPNVPSGYRLPVDLLNSVPYLVGSLVTIDSFGKMQFINGINCAIKDRVTNQLITTDPDFDTYVGSGFNTNIQSLKNIALNLSAEKSMHVTYQTFFSANSTGNFIDQAVLRKAVDDWDLSTFKNIQVIQSVLVKKLSYSMFTKFEGQVTGSTMLVNVNGGLYARSGAEKNIYEIYVIAQPLGLLKKPVTPSLPIIEPSPSPTTAPSLPVQIISTDTIRAKPHHK